MNHLRLATMCLKKYVCRGRSPRRPEEDNMKILIKKGKPKGKVKVPSSKSYSHRFLIAAALSGGSTIYNLSMCDDVKATLNGLEALGFKYKLSGSQVTFLGKKEINNPLAISKRILDLFTEEKKERTIKKKLNLEDRKSVV